MIAITGATGNTGSAAAESLLEKGEKVRAIGRSKEKLQKLADRGAEPFIADTSDAEALTRAFTGADAVYAMIPPDFAGGFRAAQERHSDALVSAIEKAGVLHVVCLSSIGADKSERVGPVNGLHSFEEKVKRVAKLNALLLRPTYFMENNLAQVKIIQTMHTCGGALKGDLRIPQIATRDIGNYAATALAKRDFSGKVVRELLGQRDVSMQETASVLGQAIGKPKLGYTHFPNFAVEMALKQMGMPEDFIKLLIEMNEALNSGWMKPLEPRSPENTTPTSIETFAAEVFAPAFQGKAATA
jgi:uncharacterized protein YbjT (DUF2867 family)